METFPNKQKKKKNRKKRGREKFNNKFSKKKKHAKDRKKKRLRTGNVHVLEKNIERDNSYPKTFINQSNEPIPNRFINSSSDTKLFATLLKTQYAGLKVDKNCFEQSQTLRSSNTNLDHGKAKEALETLGNKHFYVYDFTQPLGLNTPIARTFVTRTCVGEPGMTYKYLGLRMFAIPWSGLKVYNKLKCYDEETINALRTIRSLNYVLNLRGQYLMQNDKNGGIGGSSTNYNLTLINHMLPLSAEDTLDRNRKLKNETCFDDDPCSVSWHADSSLENYSTIAVYQTLNKANDYDNLPWRLAVRVQLDAEGPSAGRARRNVRSSNSGGNKISKAKQLDKLLSQNTPPLSIPLENSGESYFMFNTFNHHHQHAVLAGSSERWASTHRVCTTERHCVDIVLKRNTAILQNQKNALKEWSNCFNGLMEIEFEWLRQWYIQGTNHQQLHIVYWQDKIAELEQIWFKLQEKEMKKLQYLTNAVLVLESRQKQQASDMPPPPRKQRKHAQIVENMGGVNVYNACIEQLKDLIEKRAGWKKRELDGIFKRVPSRYRPIIFDEKFKSRQNGPVMMNANEMVEQLLDLKTRYEKATRTKIR